MKAALENLILRAARPYVAGPELTDAMRIAKAAKARGFSATLCYWHNDDDPADAVAAQYIRSIQALARAGIDAHLSMKVPGLRDDPQLIGDVIAEARAHGVPVDIDSHAPKQANAALAAADGQAADQLGVAIPGRWGFAPALADRAVKLGLRVRVVKGIWRDPAAPDLDPAQGFLALVDHLAGRCRAVGVATHDPVLAAESFRRLAAAGTPAEQELLYGLPMDAPAAAARHAGVPTRIYIPYGHAWIPYSVRHALKDPRAIARFVRDLATGDRDGLPPEAR